MQNKALYEFAVIRLVPKVEREEFLNIGVILFSKTDNYLKIKYHIDENRILNFSKTVDIDLVNQHIDAWKKVCKGGAHGGAIGKLELRTRFRWLVANRSTIIQSSKTHPGICDNPEGIHEKLFQLYVL